MSSRKTNPAYQPQWLKGRGLSPTAVWSIGTDGPLVACDLSRETGEVWLADGSHTLTSVDRSGQIRAMTQIGAPIQTLVWSDDGSAGAAILAEDVVIRLDRELKSQFTINLPDTCLAVAISPFGNHIAVSLANGITLIYNERKRRLAQFQTVRPLAFSRFCATEPLLFAAAEHGLLCCHDLQGGEVWQERLWNNVGGLEITGDADLVYLAAFAHGIEAFDGDGGPVGSYVVEGTVNRLAVSFEPQRLFAGTIERTLYWLDADGEMLWATSLPDDVVDLHCDPLGEWGIIGLRDEGLFRLDWQ
ncbi:MAG: hypothetical protein KDA58_02890 [Planctomycetaceae bacterium]|nr:hypothetical protein [Planctomycetaceae bacterium]